jgi:hypothetical protein
MHAALIHDGVCTSNFTLGCAQRMPKTLLDHCFLAGTISMREAEDVFNGCMWPVNSPFFHCLFRGECLSAERSRCRACDMPVLFVRYPAFKGFIHSFFLDCFILFKGYVLSGRSATVVLTRTESLLDVEKHATHLILL